MIEYNAFTNWLSTQSLRDQHYQIQDLLISIDELKAQITLLTLERDVLIEQART